MVMKPAVTSTNLSSRGAEIASGLDVRRMFDLLEGDKYDPDSNPEGFVNIGIAENYCMSGDVASYIRHCGPQVDLAPRDYTYNDGPWGKVRLRKAFANHFNRRFQPRRTWLFQMG